MKIEDKKLLYIPVAQNKLKLIENYYYYNNQKKYLKH